MKALYNHPELSAPADIPDSFAIAGIYGYMGSLLYKAALELGIKTIYGFDPGRRPLDFPDSSSLKMFEKEQDFYDVEAELFHICTPPEIRGNVFHLIERGKKINVEKPIVHPSNPILGYQMKQTINSSGASVLFDFVEAFNPRTFQYANWLSEKMSYSDFQITGIYSERSKDREDRSNPRNYKVIVPIQYQETCHCLAFILYILNKGQRFEDNFPQGLTVQGYSELYDPPNPQDYTFSPVDGKVNGVLQAGRMRIELYTNFKIRGAKAYKRIITAGIADGKPFTIEAIYDGKQEVIKANGEVLPDIEFHNRFKNIILNSWILHQKEKTCYSIKPDVNFSWLVFGLSSALWKSCSENKTLHFESEEKLMESVFAYPSSLFYPEREG